MVIHTTHSDIIAIDYPVDRFNFILQICNDLGKYGAGLSGVLASRWPTIASAYFEWHGGQGNGSSGSFKLGEIQIVRVEPHISIVNLIAQSGVRSQYNHTPIRYRHLESCMIRLYGALNRYSGIVPDGYIKIWCPPIGTGLAGGDWNKIESIVSHWFHRPEFELIYVTF